MIKPVRPLILWNISFWTAQALLNRMDINQENRLAGLVVKALAIVTLLIALALYIKLEMETELGGDFESFVGRSIVLEISESGSEFMIGGQTYDIERLEEVVAAERSRKPNANLYMAIDRSKQMRVAIQLIERLGQAGLGGAAIKQRPFSLAEEYLSGGGKPLPRATIRIPSAKG